MKILVIDVGGTFIKHAVMNESAEILSRGKIPTPMSGRAEFFETIKSIYDSVEVEGVAMSLPGVIDTERGVCVTSGALQYNDGCHVVEELEKICGVKATIENDARCAAIAEAKIGSLADVADGFVMVFGTGVGSAFIKNHELHRGKHFSAGEISFTFDTAAANTEDNIFGNLCGARGLVKAYAQMKNLSTAEMTGEKFFKAVAENENDALACLDRFTRQIAAKIFNIQMVLDVERFAIGGGISAQESFIAAIRANLDKIYADCIVSFPKVEIVPCKFRNDANLIGALFSWLAAK